jgi:aspartyl-tRNA(Asn)/glutamyl-tRNA(Gln) amidotransferase subunit B
VSAGGHRLVVGVEVHCQLSTRTKAFCACPVEFGAAPNTLCCPVCLGHPGALPVLNRAAVEKAVRAGLALGCSVAPRGHTQWDRKNYFYPDLPKGYQITQYEFPLCEGGALALGDGTKVRVRRAHLEEDTGKSSHAEDGETLIDFNRCGVPLLEIVSEPDLGTPEEVEEYLRMIQSVVRAAGASECSMEKGQMRCEPNVNLVREDGSATGISELKNLNSFAAVREAVAAEAARLAAGPWHPEGTLLPRSTFGWDDAAKGTVLQRTKETAADYRYFPEPDLPVLPTESLGPIVERAKAALAEGEAGRNRARSTVNEEAARLGLSAEQAEALLSKDITGGRFRASVGAAVAMKEREAEAAQDMARWFIGSLAGWVNAKGGDWNSLRMTPEEIATTFSLQRRGKVTPQVVKVHLLAGEYPGTGGDPEKYLAAKGLLGGAAGEDAVRAACAEVLAASPDIVARIKGGKTQAKAALVGQVMKKTRGTADPARVNAILDDLLRA